MLPAKNNIILIDCWQHLTHPLEVYAKENLKKFLQRIEGAQDWQVYVWNSGQPFDVQIDLLLKNGNFKIALELDDPIQIYNTCHLKSSVRYFYCGFHANHCLFYNTIGIEKYLQIANKSQCEFWIVSDTTMGLDPGPCKTTNLSWYNPTQIEENMCLVLNYRNQIIKSRSIESTTIQID